MNPLLMFFLSGRAFFAGAALISAGAAGGLLLFMKKSTILKICANLSVLTGLIFMLISGTPVFSAFYTILILSVIFFSASLHLMEKIPGIFLIISTALTTLTVLAAAIMEIPYTMMPELPPAKFAKMYALGDSISGGIGFPGEKTWSEVLHDKYGVNIDCRAVGGARVETVIPMAKNIKDDNVFILLEIGGNDILRSTPSAKFAKDLDTLLKTVCTGNRTVAMFALPVPPFRSDYAEIQRSLAEKYNVILIPKHYFADILTGDKYSADGLHLSNAGHARMADIIWHLFNRILNNG